MEKDTLAENMAQDEECLGRIHLPINHNRTVHDGSLDGIGHDFGGSIKPRICIESEKSTMDGPDCVQCGQKLRHNW